MPVCGSIALRTLTGQSQACYLSHSKFEACSTDVSPRVTGDSYVAHRESTPPQHFFVTGNQSINRPALSGSIQPLVTPRDTEAFVGNRPQSSSVSMSLQQRPAPHIQSFLHLTSCCGRAQYEMAHLWDFPPQEASTKPRVSSYHAIS